MKRKPGIYPNEVPSEKKTDPKWQAEIETFEALKAGLPDFHIFYNCDWTESAKKNSPSKDGEADFIVAHEDFGFITLEVKGGVVSREGQQWYSKGRKGIFKIKNPVEQARVSKHVIIRMLQENWPRMPYVRAKHGVILPHSGRPKSDKPLGADMGLEIFAFSEDMPNLAERVLQMFLVEEGQDHRKYGKLGSVGIEILHDLFTSDFKLDLSLASELDLYDNKLSQMTEEQTKLLSFIGNHERILITGGAGSGKTHLAKKIAIDLANDGKKVQVMYFNRPIQKSVAKELQDEKGISVETFHGLANRSLGSKLSLENKVDFEHLEQNFFGLILDEKGPKFDALIIDEAQDFNSDWIEALMLCVSNTGDGKVVVFSDDNQNIYTSTALLPKLIGSKPFTLSENVRNTEPIFEFSQSYYSGVTNKGSQVKGPNVRFIEADANLEKQILRDVNKLINHEGVPRENIAVLTLANIENSLVRGLAEKFPRSDDDNANSSVIFDSAWRFKGLERQVVLLCDVDEQIGKTSLLYVALTRARSLLQIYGTEIARKKLMP